MINQIIPTTRAAQEKAAEFRSIVSDKIKREGIDKLMAWLETKTDFYVSPASTRFHGAYEGGLCEHSVNVYYALKRYYEAGKNQYGWDYDEETLAVVALFHDFCKINCYSIEMRNKKVDGQWEQVPLYFFDDRLPYGHGEKSQYIVSGFMNLSREESFAIRYHMGFSGDEPKNNVGKTFEMFPLAFALSVADMEATYYVEGKSDCYRGG